MQVMLAGFNRYGLLPGLLALGLLLAASPGHAQGEFRG